MQTMNGLEWTFDTIAEKYGKFRPGYPEELYKAIFEYAGTDKPESALEVGIGSGQATLPFLRAGSRVTAVEYGENFSNICREKFGEYPGFSVITGKFEDVPLPENAFDLAYSATAFHWVPEEVGYPKLSGILKSGGVFARFANRPFRDKGNPALSDALERLYTEYYYRHYSDRKPKPQTGFGEEQAEAIARIPEKYGFTDIRHFLFHRTRTFGPREYAELLDTYSDHIALPDEIRLPFYEKITEAIDQHGGTFTVYDTIDLELARKP